MLFSVVCNIVTVPFFSQSFEIQTVTMNSGMIFAVPSQRLTQNAFLIPLWKAKKLHRQVTPRFHRQFQCSMRLIACATPNWQMQ